MTDRKYKVSDRLREDSIRLPKSIIRSERLTGNAKALYAIMVDAAHSGSEPEQEELGRLLGGGKKAAAAATKQLTDVGLVVSRRRGRGLTNEYTVLHPSEVGAEIKKGPEGTSRNAVTALQETPSGPNHARARPDSRTTTAVGGEESPPTAAPPPPPGPYDHLARVCGIERHLVIKGDDGYDKDLAREVAVALASIRRKSSATSEDQLSVEIQLRATLYRQRWPEVELTPPALAKHWNRISVPNLALGDRPHPCPHCPEAAKMAFKTERQLAEHVHVQHPEEEEAAAA